MSEVSGLNPAITALQAQLSLEASEKGSRHFTPACVALMIQLKKELEQNSASLTETDKTHVWEVLNSQDATDLSTKPQWTCLQSIGSIFSRIFNWGSTYHQSGVVLAAEIKAMSPFLEKRIAKEWEGATTPEAKKEVASKAVKELVNLKVTDKQLLLVSLAKNVDFGEALDVSHVIKVALLDNREKILENKGLAANDALDALERSDSDNYYLLAGFFEGKNKYPEEQIMSLLEDPQFKSIIPSIMASLVDRVSEEVALMLAINLDYPIETIQSYIEFKKEVGQYLDSHPTIKESDTEFQKLANKVCLGTKGRDLFIKILLKKDFGSNPSQEDLDTWKDNLCMVIFGSKRKDLGNKPDLLKDRLGSFLFFKSYLSHKKEIDKSSSLSLLDPSKKALALIQAEERFLKENMEARVVGLLMECSDSKRPKIFDAWEGEGGFSKACVILKRKLKDPKSVDRVFSGICSYFLEKQKKPELDYLLEELGIKNDENLGDVSTEDGYSKIYQNVPLRVEISELLADVTAETPTKFANLLKKFEVTSNDRVFLNDFLVAMQFSTLFKDNEKLQILDKMRQVLLQVVSQQASQKKRTFSRF